MVPGRMILTSALTATSSECVNLKLLESVNCASILPSVILPSPKLITGPGWLVQSKLNGASTLAFMLNPELTNVCACAVRAKPAATNTTMAQTAQKELIFMSFPRFVVDFVPPSRKLLSWLVRRPRDGRYALAGQPPTDSGFICNGRNGLFFGSLLPWCARSASGPTLGPCIMCKAAQRERIFIG